MSAVNDPPEYDIPHEVAGHVLYEYSEVGLMPGGFISTLITAIDRADFNNREKLAVSFPKYVEAVELVKYREDGIDILKHILREGSKAEVAREIESDHEGNVR